MASHTHTVIPDHWDETVDVLIIGSGFAGLSAALEAHDAGASVKVIEKMDKPGGNSWINGGQVAAAGSALQKKQGIQDSPQKMLEDMFTAGLNLNYPHLARIVAEQSNDTVEWTMKRVGAQYKEQVNMMGGHSVPRTLQTANGHGSEVVGKQVEALKKDGVEIDFKTRLTRLFRDESGRVLGAEIIKDYDAAQPGKGVTATVRAHKGVVLACGGFSADLQLRQSQNPFLTSDFQSTNHPGATGEGLIAALRVDAAPIQLSWIQLIPLTSPDDEGLGAGAGYIAGSGMTHGVLIDPQTGKRFVSELADRKIQSDAIIATGHPAISISDSHGVKFAWWGLQRALDSGTVKHFGTLEELAEHYGIKVDEFKKTVETFNGYVKDGTDPEFGKLIVKDARPLTEPPFYAARVWPKVHHTMGGVEINDKAQVLDLSGNVIPGLYAAGEITGGIHGGCRLGSVAIIDCLVFGRIAGQSVAAA